MIKSGSKVTVHTFAGVREGTVVEVIPSLPSHVPGVFTVAIATVEVEGRMTYRGREANHTTTVPLACVRAL